MEDFQTCENLFVSTFDAHEALFPSSLRFFSSPATVFVGSISRAMKRNLHGDERDTIPIPQLSSDHHFTPSVLCVQNAPSLDLTVNPLLFPECLLNPLLWLSGGLEVSESALSTWL